ncbi:VMAP-C domain-containing protein [Streptomyces rishiriensis]|uniref:VMAP-C domain-containing protein n=1 Tax=Streptomyces rishiriensis TaxID=68264 RepID=UPI000D596DB6|nr:trypsin-like peptidase domain-containing protein [Streptomyces rishiriensis]
MDPRRLALIRSGGVGEGRVTIGSGYLIAPRLVLTARHVLLDRVTETFWPKITVRLGHERYGALTKAGAELVWEHPDGLDVALLRIDQPIDVSDAVRWGRPAGIAPLPYEGLGYPWAAKNRERREPEYLRGVLPALSGGQGRYILDQSPAPLPRVGDGNAWGGASGAAIFCGGHLVAVVTQEDDAYGARRLIGLPVSSFAMDDDFMSHVEEHTGGCPQVSAVGAPLPKAGPAPQRTPAERELEKLLAPLFPDPAARIGHAKDLARALGYEAEGYEPGIADLAALVTAHPRALATLAEALVRAAGTVSAALTRLLSRARVLVEHGLLLSANEYDDLLGLLRGVCDMDPTLLPESAREALRYVVLPAPLTRSRLDEDHLPDVIKSMEGLFDSETVPEGTPSVPALLRLVEYVAAGADELGAGLRAWSEAVVERLGIHPHALGERRADATLWAKQPASPVSRLVMELQRDDAAGDERYRCRILLARDDGSYRVLEPGESASKTPQEVASSLNEAVLSVRQEPGQRDRAPWVTVEVSMDALRYAVDEWVPGTANDIIPARPIGADYQVSLSCPELSDLIPGREGDQERRWKMGRGATLVVPPACNSRDRLVHLLRTEHRDTARVVLHGPADERKRWLLATLGLGVPVVLWDREADGHQDAWKLESLASASDLEGLPERVRHLRSEAAAGPAERRAKPSLVWEPESRRPRTEALQLTDPSRGTNAS